MKIAIMQPYFFPYLGYVQLMNAVDTFVFFDDVNFIKKGWINRNTILTPAGEQRITLQVQKASQNRAINDHLLGDNRPKLLKTFELSYGKAPHFAAVMPFLEDCFAYEGENLSGFLEHSLIKLAGLLQMGTKFARSSDTAKPEGGLKAQEHILFLCEAHGASHYINPEGGRELYDASAFEARGMELSFLHYQSVDYPQFQAGGDFISHLSIIDVLMFNGVEGTRELLSAYTLES